MANNSGRDLPPNHSRHNAVVMLRLPQAAHESQHNEFKMSIRHLTAAISVSLLVGCQTASRPYDGVLGFKATNIAESRHDFFYIDEDRRTWEAVEAKAKKACSRSLGVKQASTTLGILSKTQLSQSVSMPVSVQIAPAGVSTGAAGMGSQSAAGTVSYRSSINHYFDREIKLKKIVGVCLVSENP